MLKQNKYFIYFYLKAANLFQTHDFKKSLQIYDQCISICKKNN